MKPESVCPRNKTKKLMNQMNLILKKISNKDKKDKKNN